MSENISREICKLRMPSKINPLQSACSLGILRFWPHPPITRDARLTCDHLIDASTNFSLRCTNLEAIFIFCSKKSAVFPMLRSDTSVYLLGEIFSSN